MRTYIDKTKEEEKGGERGGKGGRNHPTGESKLRFLFFKNCGVEKANDKDTDQQPKKGRERFTGAGR